MIFYLAVRHFYLNHLQLDPEKLYILTYQKQIWDYSPPLKNAGLTRHTNLTAFRQQNPGVEVIPISLGDFAEANQELLAFCRSWTDEIEVEYPHALYCRIASYLDLEKFTIEWLRAVKPLTALWGGGESKFVAKLAAHTRGNVIIDPHCTKEFLDTTAIRWLPLAEANQLEKLGFSTIGQLASLTVEELSSQIGAASQGVRTLITGGDITPFLPEKLTTFQWEIDFTTQPEIAQPLSRPFLDNYLKQGCQYLTEQLQQKQKLTKKIAIRIRGSKAVVDTEKKITQPTKDPAVLYRALENILPLEPVTEIQVEAKDIIDDSYKQLQLITDKVSASPVEKLRNQLGPFLTQLTVKRREKVLAMWEEQFL